jgi:PAS domain S-box-containing protein
MQFAISQLLASESRLENISKPVLAAIGRSLALDIGFLWVRSPGQSWLTCIESWHSDAFVSSQFEQATCANRFQRGVGLPGRVWEQQSVIWMPDLALETTLARARDIAAEQLKSAIAFPILDRGEIVGVAEFFTRQVREPDRDLIATLVSVGNQLGQFIQRSRSEEALRASENRKTAILESALDCIISIDTESRVLEFNPAAERTFGYPRAEALGRLLPELIIPPDLRDRHYRGMRRYLETGDGPVIGKRLELRGMRSDGSTFPVELAITRLPHEDPPVFTAYIRYLSERHRTESALITSEGRLAALFENVL